MTAAASATATKAHTDTTAFHCSGDWHLIRLGKYAVAIHALMLRVQGDELDFFGSIGQIAEYFFAGERHIRAALHRLVKTGFVVKIASRSGNSTIYRALTHKEWAEQHPGVCAVKKDTGQGMEFDPSPKGVGVQDIAAENVPLPEKGSTPLPKRDGHPSPKRVPKSPKQSPRKLPRDTDSDNRVAAKNAASLDACQRAFNLFGQEMETETAFVMVLWILYQAASSGQVPQSVAYYTQAKHNFMEQHEDDWESVLDSAAYARFDKHAYRFVEAHNPDLLQWLKATSKKLERTSPVQWADSLQPTHATGPLTAREEIEAIRCDLTEATGIDGALFDSGFISDLIDHYGRSIPVELATRVKEACPGEDIVYEWEGIAEDLSKRAFQVQDAYEKAAATTA